MGTITKRYEELNKKLEINILNIDRELMAASQDIQACAELAADANDEEHSAKLALDIMIAEVSDRLRTPEEGKKAKSETQIASEILLDQTVQAARDEYNKMRHQAEICNALANSMRTKANLVRDTCSMVVAGYITPSSYSPKRVQLMKKE